MYNGISYNIYVNYMIMNYQGVKIKRKTTFRILTSIIDRTARLVHYTVFVKEIFIIYYFIPVNICFHKGT